MLQCCMAMQNYCHRVDHLDQLRRLQDKTNGFQTFIPLKFRNENNQLSHLSEVSVVEDLRKEVVVDAAPGALQEYAWGRKSLAFVRCGHCGCVTHWRALAGRKSLRSRLFEPEQIGPVRIRQLDGAVTEDFIGEYGPVWGRATAERANHRPCPSRSSCPTPKSRP